MKFVICLGFGACYLGFSIFLPNQSTAQSTWYKYPGNPVFQAGKIGDWDENLFDFDIIYEDNEYHMWYVGFRMDDPTNKSFGFATSPDGIHWEKYEENPLLFNSNNVEWIGDIATFDVVRKDSLYLMWFTVQVKDIKLSSGIGYAWSADGLTWHSHPYPVLTSGENDAWDGNSVANPCVIFDGQIYHMWFSGWANHIPKTVTTGYATSRNGISWQKHQANPVLTIGYPGSWDDYWAVPYSVTYNGSLFELWYFGWDLIKFEIGLATSHDGINWAKSPENPILKQGELGSWDAIMIGPKALNLDSVYHIWYAGLYNPKVSYGYATSSNSNAEIWEKTTIETQQRVIRVQVFNRLEYINIDSLSIALQELSGTALIDAYNKLALAYSLNDDSECYNYAVKAFELAEKENYSKGEAMALYSMGNSQYVLDNYSEALANQLTAFRLFDSLGMQSEAGNLLSQIASIYRYAGLNEQACNYLQQSLDVFISLKDTNSTLNTLNYLGKAYLDSGDTIQARKTFEKELYLARLNNQAINEGFAYEGIGRCFQGSSLDSAIYYFTNARAKWGRANQSQAAANWLLMAETFLVSGPEYYPKAEECLQQSVDYLLATVGEGQNQLRWCYRMAELNMLTQRYGKAKEYLDLSLKMCVTFLSKHDHQQYISLNQKLEFGILLKEYMEKIYRLYYELDIVLRDKDGALLHFMLATAWRDSVSNDQAWKKVATIQGQFETELSQNQIALLEKDNEVKDMTLKKSRIYLFGLGVLVLIVTLIAFIFIRQRKIRSLHALELEQVKSEKLQELDLLKSQFFANISHEFRTPLTLILGPLEKLLTSTSDETEKKQLTTAKKYTKNLQHLIDQLLTLSKLESGKLQLHAAEIDIVRLVRGYLQAFESMAQRKNISFSFKSDQDEMKAFIDREKFEQIMNNLLSNAFKFTSEGSSVSIQVRQLDNWTVGQIDQHDINKFNFGQLQTAQLSNLSANCTVISIADTGPGISPEHLPHIFDRFYQADNGNSYPGTGIGLALTKELVELHHGAIYVESELGKGTAFTIYLPLGNGHLTEKEMADGSRFTVHSSQSDVEPERAIQDTRYSILENQNMKPRSWNREPGTEKPLLLIVEDNADMRSYIREYFEGEYQITEAKDGVDGYEKAAKNIPDIIISDVMMPKMDGNELCSRVKSDECTSHIPVILLTARASKENRIEGLETGADDFITKPFDGEELRVRVNNLIGQRKRLQAFYRRDLELIRENILKQDLTIDEKFLQKAKTIIENNLSNTEYGVMDFASDMAMSRVQLYRKLSALLDNSVSEFIRNIRLNHAAELLKKKAGTITEIAYDSGFNNPSYFSMSFRNHFGVSPTEYQKLIDES